MDPEVPETIGAMLPMTDCVPSGVLSPVCPFLFDFSPRSCAG